MRPVAERPLLAQLSGANFGALALWATELVKSLIAHFQEIGVRLNRVLPKDGSEAMEGPLVPKTHTVATLPAASSVTPGGIVYVSDGGAGARWRGSDGSAWHNLG